MRERQRERDLKARNMQTGSFCLCWSYNYMIIISLAGALLLAAGSLSQLAIPSEAAPPPPPPPPSVAVDAAVLSSSSSSSSSGFCDAPAVFAFGDSLTDTGNVVLTFNPILTQPLSLPYGSAFFHQAVHRFSNGRILIDHLMTSVLGKPFLNPFLRFVGTDFSHGVNYAVGSATALNVSMSTILGATPTVSQTLDIQLKWHDSMLTVITSGLKRSVTKLPSASSIGEAIYFLAIGGNDISNYVQALMTYEDIMSILPFILDKVKSSIEHLYENGAHKFVISGVGTLGCRPITKYFLRTSDLDSRGCVAWVNEICRNYSDSLGLLATSMENSFPNSRFVFLDLYSAFEDLITNPSQYGINDTMNACCRAPRDIAQAVNGYHPTAFCGPSALVCDAPHTFMVWDGIHFTEQTYYTIFQRFMNGDFIVPSTIFSSCNHDNAVTE